MGEEDGGRSRYTTHSILVTLNIGHACESAALLLTIYILEPTCVLHDLTEAHRQHVLMIALLGTPLSWVLQIYVLYLGTNPAFQNYNLPKRMERTRSSSHSPKFSPEFVFSW